MPADRAAPALTPLSQMSRPQKAKSISFLTAVALVVGSAIGSGIFFKNRAILDNTQGNIGIAIGCWAVAALGIIAIGLALLEVATATRRNKGVLGWTEVFTFRAFHAWSKGYMALFYYPTTMVAVPLYAVQALSDATGHLFPWWQALLLAMGLATWLMLVSAVSTRAAAGFNWVFTVIKFVPILLVPVYGFIDAGSSGAPALVQAGHASTGLTAASPYLGIMASIPAIFFAFDGFYTVASLSTDLKKPRRMPWAMVLGILVITAAYLLISAGVFVSSPTGSASGLTMPEGVRTAVNYGVFVAVLAIINGYAASTFKAYDDAINEGDFFFERRLSRFRLAFGLYGRKRSADGQRRPFLTVVFSPGFNFFWTSTLAWYALVALISAFNTYDGSNLGGAYSYAGSGREDALYSLADLLTNWSSMVVFVIIAAALVGGLVNRRTKRTNVERKGFFVPFAWLAIVLVLVPAGYLVANTLAGIAGVNGADPYGSLYYWLILVGTLALGLAFNLYYALTGRTGRVSPAPVAEEPLAKASGSMAFVSPPPAGGKPPAGWK